MSTKILTFLTQYTSSDKWYEYNSRAHKIYENVTSNIPVAFLIWLFCKAPIIFIILIERKVICKNITNTQRKYAYIYCVIMWILLSFVAGYFLHPYKFMDRVNYLFN